MADIRNFHPVSSTPFDVGRTDAAECRRLRLRHRLTSEAMADIARLSGRWAWLAIEAGYEPIHPGCWVLCLVSLGEYPGLQGDSKFLDLATGSPAELPATYRGCHENRGTLALANQMGWSMDNDQASGERSRYPTRAS